MTDRSPPPDTTVSVHHDGTAPPLRPADPQDVLQAVAFALCYHGRRRVHDAGGLMARITAERIAEHPARSGFVVMHRAPASAGPDRHFAAHVPPGELPGDRT